MIHEDGLANLISRKAAKKGKKRKELFWSETIASWRLCERQILI
jgi:hypothetical protein